MKKNWKCMLTGSAAAILTAGAITVSSAAVAPTKSFLAANTAFKVNTVISEANAKEIAIKHVGLSVSDVEFCRAKLDHDDGRIKYEVEFWSGQTEYEYDVDAVSGEIVGYSIKDYTAVQPQSGAQIDIEKAKEIALEHAGLSALDFVFTCEKSEYEHGIRVYEVKLYGGNRMYSYEIDASSGKILSYDFDEKRYAVQNTPGDYISQSKAQEIALKQAGLSTDDVKLSSVKLDYDDGWAKYEIELWNGQTEYEYDVDAVSGEIVGYSIKYYAVLAQSQSGAQIDIEKAKEIALEHAGLSALDFVFTCEKSEHEHGRRIYEVKFYNENNKYCYEIDASSGEILSYDFDKKKKTQQSTLSNSEKYISEAEVKKIVEGLAGTSGTFKKMKLEFEHGSAIYEGKMYSGEVEYEFEIDALTGAVLEWEVDWD